MAEYIASEEGQKNELMRFLGRSTEGFWGIERNEQPLDFDFDMIAIHETKSEKEIHSHSIHLWY